MDIPSPDFHVFGMGPRRKHLYRAGALLDAVTGQELRRWDVAAEKIDPAEHRVEMETPTGGAAIIEDEAGLRVEEPGGAEVLAESPLNLPRFEGKRSSGLLRALHGEILVNIVPAGPVPCLLVYDSPWYRDAAMMCMVLERTGNTGLVADWIMSLTEIFDRNNAGNREPDNLGELLYMISLVSDDSHPLVPEILAAAKEFRRERHIVGLTDGGEHPVYQTKWLKYGLRALGLDDPYEIPEIADSYSALFWMDWRETHVPVEPFGERSRELYPYLAWAEAHFHRWPAPMELAGGAGSAPLTWEARASEADYGRMAAALPAHAEARVSLPHTWHAAEMFLYLIEDPHLGDGGGDGDE